MKAVKIVLAGVCYFMSFMFYLISRDSTIGYEEANNIYVFFLIIAVILTFSVFKVKKTKSLKIQHNGSTITAALNHVNGLPIPENNQCVISSFPDKIEISTNGAIFNLDKEKITDVFLKTDVEIQKQQVSSVGGAIGGAILFGPLGAVIGGRSTEKTSRTIYTYLIFAYVQEEKIAYIGFDATYSIALANLFVTEFSNIEAKPKMVYQL